VIFRGHGTSKRDRDGQANRTVPWARNLPELPWIADVDKQARDSPARMPPGVRAKGTNAGQSVRLLPKPIRSGVDCARKAGEIFLFSR
jgi:hypothetical protein